MLLEMDAAADWKTHPVIMMDFEGSASSGVVEYGLVELHRGEIASTDTALCRPTGSISTRDTDVHGIREAATRNAAPFSDCYAAFVDWRRKGVFAAHNRHAENGFLKNTWALPPAVPDWRQGEGETHEWDPWIDTLSLYRAYYPRLHGYGLGELTDVFELRKELNGLAEAFCPKDRRKPHCALYDALASALLLLYLERTTELAGRLSIGWLIELSEGRPTQRELF